MPTIHNEIPERGDYTIEVGDTVVVSLQSRRGLESGTITKIGTKLVHVDVGSWQKLQFRKADQQRNDGWTGWFRTLEQQDNIVRRDAAIRQLWDHGLQFRDRIARGHSWSTERLIRLVEFLDTLDQSQPTS
jgi:phenylpropionate dioxygenase-like ring-hydroxylating dioxygenase large terminal subunit